MTWHIHHLRQHRARENAETCERRMTDPVQPAYLRWLYCKMAGFFRWVEARERRFKYDG